MWSPVGLKGIAQRICRSISIILEILEHTEKKCEIVMFDKQICVRVRVSRGGKRNVV